MARNLIGSDTALRSIKPGDPRRRISDGEGLYLLLFVKGGAHGWRFDYSIHGKRKTLSLGTYPTIGIGLARERAEDARKKVAQGVDPSEARKAVKAAGVQARAESERADAGLPALNSFELISS